MLAFLVPGRKDADARDGSIATVPRCPRDVRFPPDSDQIADAPRWGIKCAPTIPENTCEPKSTNAPTASTGHRDH
jgi:hypothetical protein